MNATVTAQVLPPRMRTIEVFPVDPKLACPDKILAILADRFHVGDAVRRAEVLSCTALCFDVASDYQLDADEVPVFVWRQI